MVQGQPRKTVCKAPSPKKPEQNGLEVCESGRVLALQMSKDMKYLGIKLIK
jgi:hypothetical protein